MSAPSAERDLRPADKPAFVALMASAFARDPLFVDVFGSDDHGASTAVGRRQAFFEFMFDQCLIAGHGLRASFQGERMAACWIVEDSRRKPPVLRVLWRFLRLAPKLPLRSTKVLNDYMRRTRRHAPRVPHHYLTMIGVHPSAQGQGIGSRIVRGVVDAARKSGVRAVALDTENRDNVGRYAKLGFKETAQVPVGRVVAYCMDLTF